jgi:hypothetical protein
MEQAKLVCPMAPSQCLSEGTEEAEVMPQCSRTFRLCIRLRYDLFVIPYVILLFYCF